MINLVFKLVFVVTLISVSTSHLYSQCLPEPICYNWFSYYPMPSSYNTCHPLSAPDWSYATSYQSSLTNYNIKKIEKIKAVSGMVCIPGYYSIGSFGIATNKRFLLTKYTGDLNIVWSKSVTLSSESASQWYSFEPTDIIEDFNGDIIVCGGADLYTIGTGSFTSQKNSFIAKFSSSGSMIWFKFYSNFTGGLNGSSQFSTVSVNTNNDILATGLYNLEPYLVYADGLTGNVLDGKSILSTQFGALAAFEIKSSCNVIANEFILVGGMDYATHDPTCNPPISLRQESDAVVMYIEIVSNSIVINSLQLIGQVSPLCTGFTSEWAVDVDVDDLGVNAIVLMKSFEHNSLNIQNSIYTPIYLNLLISDIKNNTSGVTYAKYYRISGVQNGVWNYTEPIDVHFNNNPNCSSFSLSCNTNLNSSFLNVSGLWFGNFSEIDLMSGSITRTRYENYGNTSNPYFNSIIDAIPTEQTFQYTTSQYSYSSLLLRNVGGYQLYHLSSNSDFCDPQTYFSDEEDVTVQTTIHDLDPSSLTINARSVYVNDAGVELNQTITETQVCGNRRYFTPILGEELPCAPPLDPEEEAGYRGNSSIGDKVWSNTVDDNFGELIISKNEIYLSPSQLKSDLHKSDELNCVITDYLGRIVFEGVLSSSNQKVLFKTRLLANQPYVLSVSSNSKGSVKSFKFLILSE